MAWVRIDEDFAQHPKVVSVGPLGMALQVAGLCYCNRNLTDGFIPWGAAQTLLSWEFLGPREEAGAKRYAVAVTCGMHGDDVATEFVIGLLLDAGIWEEVTGGYQIHDYEDYQPTKAEVLAERAAARKRMSRKKFGGNSAEVRPNFKCPVPDPVSDPDLVIDQDTTTTITDLTAFITTHFGASPHIVERLTAFVDDGMQPSCVLRACEIAVEMDKRTVRYVESILNRWYEAGIRTRDQAQHAERQFRKRKASGQAPTTTSLPTYDSPEDQAKVEELQRELKSLAEGMTP